MRNIQYASQNSQPIYKSESLKSRRSEIFILKLWWEWFPKTGIQGKKDRGWKGEDLQRFLPHCGRGDDANEEDPTPAKGMACWEHKDVLQEERI